MTLIAGSVLILLSAVLLGSAGMLAGADQTQQGGYLTTGTATYSTADYALTSDPTTVHGPVGMPRPVGGRGPDPCHRIETRCSRLRGRRASR